jgi:hypothetical protein
VLEIRRGGEALVRKDDYMRFRIGESFDEPDRKVRPGRDVSGDGVPDVVVHGCSGGSRCCFTAWVYFLGERLELLAEIPGAQSDPAFVNADADSAIEVEVVDWTFEHFPYSFARSPSPRVVLDWNGNELRVSPVLTSGPRPDRDELLLQARAVRELLAWRDEPRTWPYADVFPPAIGLMYAGHPDLGWLYLLESWSESEQERVRLEQQVEELLSASIYYGTLVSGRRDSY